MDGSDRRKSRVQALQEASDQLAAAQEQGSSQGLFDAHVGLFDVLAERAMVAEAGEQLALAGESLTRLKDPTRSRAFDARAATLALMIGDYARAEELIGAADGSLPIQRFILRRDTEPSVEQGSLSALLATMERSPSVRKLEIWCAMDETNQAADAGAIYVDLLQNAGCLAIAPDLGCFGPVDRYLGLLSSNLNRPDDAERHLNDAVRIADRCGLLPWVARSRVDLAKCLLSRGRAADEDRAHENVAAARAAAQRIGMVGLELPGDAVVAPPAVSVSTNYQNVFRRDGEFWTITFGGTSFSLKDTKGLLYLARLLGAPGKEIHSLDLVHSTSSDEGASTGRKDRATTGLASDPFSATGDVLDAEAREDYRQRIADLDAEIAEAEGWNDPERVARLHDERDFLVRELVGAVGLGGRSRTTSSASERARVSVTKAIWSSIDRINVHGPELGRHLSLSVHTGTYCSYTPDPALKIVWHL